MGILGVLTCEILELEFAYLLAKDRAIAGVTVIENAYSENLIESLDAAGLNPSRRILYRGFRPNHPGKLEVLIQVLELALHNRKQFLQEGVVKAAKEMGRYVDGIVLGYGLCGNALQKPNELLEGAGVPVFIPMDEDHPVDDCVGLIIGGRKCYYKEQCEVAGTFFMIPGWTRHWKRVFQKEHGKFDIQFAKRLFRMTGYERSLLIPNPVLSEEELRDNIEEFNRLFGFRTEVRQGTLDILERTWERAKECIPGKKEKDDHEI